MANGSRQSRSPVRAITSVDHPDPRWRPTGSGPAHVAADRHAAPPALAPAAAAHAMSCPRCGSALQLQLQPAPTPPSMVHEEGAPALRAAPAPDPLPDFESTVKDYKRRLIRRALEENGDVMTRAAKALGLKYTTFVAMAHRLGVVQKDENGDDDAS